ncbi:PRC-barrel domain-containing protein [Plantactinospora sp. CA-290183]|uniref:PRC-barrel domain-containing protein n=1 Tax=Plantactinospora sp. CA-290183 TaxID=3240006 RepID=UPI003D911090
MDNLGAPVAYLALTDGVPVYDRNGDDIGTVEHVLADEGADIFHGLVVRAASDRHLFAAREQIGTLHERGVVLTVPRAELHEPSEDAVAADATNDSVREQAGEGLRRAWKWLSRPR